MKQLICMSAALIALTLVAAAPANESAPLPAEKIPAPIRAAVASPDRPDADKALDAGRQPAQLLAFFGAAPGMKAADLFAGGGYTTELLARIAGPQGKVWSQLPILPPEMAQVEQAWTERLKKPALSNTVAVHANFDADFLPVPPGSLDLVVINLNYHDLVLRGVDREKVNAAVFRALRPGGDLRDRRSQREARRRRRGAAAPPDRRRAGRARGREGGIRARRRVERSAPARRRP